MLNKPLIKEKLRRIEDYYRQFEEFLTPEIEEIRKDPRTYYAIERIFTLIVDEILDINLHIIRAVNLRIGDDLQSSFKILAENEVLPEDFAEKFAPTVGMRNILIHRYEKINRDLFLRLCKKEKEDFRKYVKFIQEYLEKA